MQKSSKSKLLGGNEIEREERRPRLIGRRPRTLNRPHPSPKTVMLPFCMWCLVNVSVMVGECRESQSPPFIQRLDSNVRFQLRTISRTLEESSLSAELELACPPNHNGYYPTSDCRDYFWCHNGSPSSNILYECGVGLLFDVDRGFCNWEGDVDCTFLVVVKEQLSMMESSQYSAVNDADGDVGNSQSIDDVDGNDGGFVNVTTFQEETLVIIPIEIPNATTNWTTTFPPTFSPTQYQFTQPIIPVHDKAIIGYYDPLRFQTGRSFTLVRNTAFPSFSPSFLPLFLRVSLPFSGEAPQTTLNYDKLTLIN